MEQRNKIGLGSLVIQSQIQTMSLTIYMIIRNSQLSGIQELTKSDQTTR